jgi:hypothetical protein
MLRSPANPPKAIKGRFQNIRCVVNGGGLLGGKGGDMGNAGCKLFDDLLSPFSCGFEGLEFNQLALSFCVVGGYKSAPSCIVNRDARILTLNDFNGSSSLSLVLRTPFHAQIVTFLLPISQIQSVTL